VFQQQALSRNIIGGVDPSTVTPRDVLMHRLRVILTVAGAIYPAWQAARMQPIAAMRVDV